MKFLFVCLPVWLMYFYLPTATSNMKNKLEDEMSNDIPGTGNNYMNDFESLASSTAGLFESDVAADIVSNILQADRGALVQNLLSNALQNPDTTSQILSGISSMLNNKNEAGPSIDSNMMEHLVSFMAQQQKPNRDSMLDVVSSVVGNVAQVFTDNGENPASLLMSSLSSFIGPEASNREHQHASHAHLLPPLIEKAHLYFDHFKHTELYKAIWRVTGLDKIFQTFTVNGEFNYGLFFERLENKNFRKHWIHVITQKITDMLAIVTDSSRYKKYINTGVSLFNGFLKSADFPKSTLFDITRPSDTLTKFFNYFLKKYLTMDMDTSRYVVPAVAYVEDILHMAHNKGFLYKEGLNSNDLAQKLTDTLNLEIIEPILRVWRAYRFAKKVPECDKYVMCLINQEDPESKTSLPGLKIGLSKTASMFASWFLADKTGTSFWTLYSTINDEKDCSIRFLEKCNDFHIEEVKVESEYIHTEL